MEKEKDKANGKSWVLYNGGKDGEGKY
jgi:hypothetical protein